MKQQERKEMNLGVKWVRGRILKYLYKNRSRVNAEMLWELLDMYNMSITDTEVLHHLDYLGKKGYLTIHAERLSRDSMGIIFLELTPKGMDLVQGFVPDDPGIEV